MKRDYLAIAIGSLLVFGPNALADGQTPSDPLNPPPFVQPLDTGQDDASAADTAAPPADAAPPVKVDFKSRFKYKNLPDSVQRQSPFYGMDFSPKKDLVTLDLDPQKALQNIHTDSSIFYHGESITPGSAPAPAAPIQIAAAPAVPAPVPAVPAAPADATTAALAANSPAVPAPTVAQPAPAAPPAQAPAAPSVTLNLSSPSTSPASFVPPANFKFSGPIPQLFTRATASVDPSQNALQGGTVGTPPAAPAAPAQQADPAAQAASAAPAPAPVVQPQQGPASEAEASSEISQQTPAQVVTAPPAAPQGGVPSPFPVQPQSLAQAPGSDVAPTDAEAGNMSNSTLDDWNTFQQVGLMSQLKDPSCQGLDTRGTTGLYDKGQIRLERISNIVREMHLRSQQAQQAAKENMNKVLRKDSTLPTDMEAKAKCMMVIPNEISGGISGVEGEYGAGAYRCKDANNQFGPYHFIQLKGANLGFQLGGKFTDRVLFFMNDSSQAKLESLAMKDKLKVGVRAGATLGVGRDASISTSWDAKDDIRSYSQSKGLYVGVSLEGSLLTHDNNMDQVMAGGGVSKIQKKWWNLGGLLHLGHRNICEAVSNQSAPGPIQASDGAAPANGGPSNAGNAN